MCHAFLDWPENYMEQANQLGELISFWIVGMVAGLLFEREKSLLQDLVQANEETLLGLVAALIGEQSGQQVDDISQEKAICKTCILLFPTRFMRPEYDHS